MGQTFSLGRIAGIRVGTAVRFTSVTGRQRQTRLQSGGGAMVAERIKGAIVNVSSVHDLAPLMDGAAYCTSRPPSPC